MYIEKVSSKALNDYISKNKDLLINCQPTDFVEILVNEKLDNYKKLAKDLATKSAYIKIYDQNKKLKQTTRLKFNDNGIFAQFSYSKYEFAPVNLPEKAVKEYKDYIKQVASKYNQDNHQDEQLTLDF